MRKKASATLEYAFLMVIAVISLMAMYNYIRDAVSGKWKDSIDAFGFAQQYEPGVTQIIKE